MAEAFHDVLFPTDIAIGARGGPVRKTDVTSLSSGQERRVARWAGSRRRFDAGFGIRGAEDIDTLIAFFEAREGRRFAFRFRDPFDQLSVTVGTEPSPTDQVLGVGDGTTTQFDVIKTYSSGGLKSVRRILLPVAASLRVAVDGGELTSSDYSFAPVMSQVALNTPPPVGAEVTAGYRFDMLARFDTDALVLSAQLGGGAVPNVPIVEVLG